jgi:hypothetical protein
VTVLLELFTNCPLLWKNVGVPTVVRHDAGLKVRVLTLALASVAASPTSADSIEIPNPIENDERMNPPRKTELTSTDGDIVCRRTVPPRRP